MILPSDNRRMDIQEKQRLEFHWERLGERYVFRCKVEAPGDPDQFNEQLDGILRWCRDRRLRPESYRLQATRRTVSEKVEEFDLSGRNGKFDGSTKFHPAVLSVELELPEDMGPVFSLAFNVTDARRS